MPLLLAILLYGEIFLSIESRTPILNISLTTTLKGS